MAQEVPIEDIKYDEKNAREQVQIATSLITGLNSGSRILDLGCGSGRHYLELARRGYPRVIGLDIDFADTFLLNHWQLGIRKLGIAPRFVKGDWNSLPFSAAAFDYIIMFNGFDVNPDKLREVSRVLKSGGQFVFNGSDGDELVRIHQTEGTEYTRNYQIPDPSDGQIAVARIIYRLDQPNQIRYQKLEWFKNDEFVIGYDETWERYSTLEQRREMLSQFGLSLETFYPVPVQAGHVQADPTAYVSAHKI